MYSGLLFGRRPLRETNLPLPRLYLQTQEVANVNIECGTGEQILRWLAYTACARLSYIRGEWPPEEKAFSPKISPLSSPSDQKYWYTKSGLHMLLTAEERPVFRPVAHAGARACLYGGLIAFSYSITSTFSS